MSGDKYLTSGKAIPVLSLLIDRIYKNTPLSVAAIKLQKQLLLELNSRMADLNENDVLLKACLLDPRYKGKYIKDQVPKDRIIREVGEEILLLERSQNPVPAGTHSTKISVWNDIVLKYRFGTKVRLLQKYVLRLVRDGKGTYYD